MGRGKELLSKSENQFIYSTKNEKDLVYQKVPGYYAFNDNMLMRYIYNIASQGVEGIDLPPPRI